MPNETQIETLIYALFNSGRSIADINHDCQSAILHISNVNYARCTRAKLLAAGEHPSEDLNKKCEL